MVYEFRELTEKEHIELVDKGQRIMALGVAKGAIQTEREAAQAARQPKIDAIRAEIAKNMDAINAIRSASIADKVVTFKDLADAEIKQIVDLDQRNRTLNGEIAKINKELGVLETSFHNREQVIAKEIVRYTSEISKLRDVTEK
jgi:hypothetical protein